MNLLCKILLLAILATFPRAGMAQEPEPFRGIFCDTREQIERVVTKGTELGGAEQGINAVNAEAKLVAANAPNACIFTVIHGVRGKELTVIDSPEGKLAVVPFLVVAVQTPFGVIPAADGTVWYTLTEPKGQGV